MTTLPDQPAVPDIRTDDALMLMAEIVSGRLTGPGTMAVVEELLRSREKAIRAESAAALQEARDRIDRLEFALGAADLDIRGWSQRAEDAAERANTAEAALREATAEVERLRGRMERWRARYDVEHIENAALRDEVERLREALEEVSLLAYASVSGSPLSPHHRAFGNIVQIAAAASRSLPARSLRELAVEQGIDLDGPPPDYVALATAVWPTEADVEAFNTHLDPAAPPAQEEGQP